jgi:phage FluMu gp28-like protein
MFLKYQKKFLNSKAKLKVLCKSRQIGATWITAYDACLQGGRKERPRNT